MVRELTLRSTGRSGLLLPATYEQALGLLAKLSPTAPRGTMHGQELRLALALDLDDDACFGAVLDFAGQGARVTTSTHGPSAALVTWATHSIGATLKAELLEDGQPSSPTPEAHRAAAVVYLEEYEGAVRESREQGREPDGDAFVAWLAREDYVALAARAAGETFADLPLDAAPRLYEILLESDAIDDLFVSERELARLLARFLARFRS